MADNIEVADLYTNSNNDRSKQIDEFIGHVGGTISNRFAPWQWIIDFSGFAVWDLLAKRLFSQLITIIKGIHGYKLKKIIIIRPSWHCKLFLSTIGRNFSKNISTLILIDNNNLFRSIVDTALDIYTDDDSLSPY